MGLAIFPVHLSVLESALHLPEGYHLVFAQHEINSPVVRLLVESDAIPTLPTAMHFPTLDLLVYVHCHPEDRSFCKYTTEAKLREY